MCKSSMCECPTALLAQNKPKATIVVEHHADGSTDIYSEIDLKLITIKHTLTPKEINHTLKNEESYILPAKGITADLDLFNEDWSALVISDVEKNVNKVDGLVRAINGKELISGGEALKKVINEIAM